MKKLLICSVIGWLMLSCEDPYVNNGIVDPPAEEVILGDPVISSVAPLEGGAFTLVTITGDNFSVKKEENEVTINGVVARIIAVSKTSIQIEVPENAETGVIAVRVLTKSVEGPEFTFIRTIVYDYISETYAGIVGTQGFEDGARETALFKVPEGIDRDSQGNLFIADRDNHVIRKITPDGTVSLVAGVVGQGGDEDGNPFTAKFKAPLKVAVDAQDNIYVTDRDNHKVRKIDAVTGLVSTVAGTGERAYLDGPAASAKFYTPIDVVVANDGTIYVSESQDRVRKISTDGIVSTLAGSSRGWMDGIGTAARLSDPSGIDLDKDGNIWVADRRNHRIRMITPSGEVTTVAGTGSGGHTDGLDESARFSHPWGVYCADDGVVYVADANTNSIRMRNTEGVWSTIAGGASTSSAGHQDGNASESKYNYPTDLTVDESTGTIYVVDYSNQVIRRILKVERP